MNLKADTITSLERQTPDPTSNNAAVVRQVLTETHRHCLSYLQGRLGSAEEARDVMQSFMLRAIDRAEGLRDITTVRGWLSRLLATAISDHQRKAARRRQRETAMSPEFFDMTPADAEVESELDSAICACLNQLMPTLRHDYADLLRRIDLQEEPREAVAASLGISMANLAVRLHRARQALKQRLVEMCLTCPEHGFMDCGCDAARRAELLRAAAKKD